MTKDYSFTSNSYKALTRCPASLGPKTNIAKPHLDRWIYLKEAIEEWLYNDALDEASISQARNKYANELDPIQTKICDDLFETFRTIYPKTDKMSMSREYPPIPRSESKDLSEDEKIILSSWVQFEADYGDKRETIKLRTGKDAIDNLDLAILALQKDTNETNIEINLTKGTVEELPVIDGATEILNDAFEQVQRYLTLNKKETIPGKHCNLCDRPSICGQYKEIHGKKISNKNRSLYLTKTDLMKLETCNRQAAWKFLYGIPKDVDEEEVTENYGDIFHAYTQKIINEFDNPLSSSGMKKFSEIISEESEEIKVKLLETYSSLVEQMSSYDNVQLKATEFPLGFTILPDQPKTKTEGKSFDENLAVTFMGMADIVGRINNNIPVVVELKTGKERSIHQHEASLYALGASQATNEKEVIVLHVYMSPTSSKITERVYKEKELNKAKEYFVTKSMEISNWDQKDTLSPSYNPGSWCEYCSYERRCLESRK